MGHLSKIKCLDSRVNVQCAHFSFNKCPIYTHDGASAKFSTNSQETDNSAGVEHQRVKTHGVKNNKGCDGPVVFNKSSKNMDSGQERFCCVYAYCTRLAETIPVDAPYSIFLSSCSNIQSE
jgi:hypothetical protein